MSYTGVIYLGASCCDWARSDTLHSVRWQIICKTLRARELAIAMS